MVEPIQDDFHRKFLAPLVVGMTTLTWTEALLEAITHGGMHSPDALADIYLTLMSGYVAGIEVQKWTQVPPMIPGWNVPSVQA